MALYTVEAINIKSFDLGEADKLVTLFSRERGKIRAVAKGARRMRSRFGGRLELLCQHKALLLEGKSLDQLQQSETVESFFSLKENIETLASAQYFAWVVDKGTEEKHANEPLYRLLADCMTLLKQGQDVAAVRNVFQKKVLEIEGIMPQLGEYVSDRMFERYFGDYASLTAPIRR